MVRQEIANLPFRNGRVGSIPTLSAKFTFIAPCAIIVVYSVAYGFDDRL
jgi:hypothetical protein